MTLFDRLAQREEVRLHSNDGEGRQGEGSQPEGYQPKVAARRMAESLDGLDGKKVFLVDVGFANSDNFMA